MKQQTKIQELAYDILQHANTVILGKEIFNRQVLTALLAGGHILLEDLPGVGKTTLALTYSKLMGFDWRRVQFTPDVLPSDLTGFSVYRRETEEFVYQPGAVFCNLLLADEINRTSPKTQSALLEAMEERQVTVDGVTRKLPSPFYVIATQNPLGAAGTQPLPYAQTDRFMISLSMGYPDFESELTLARENSIDGRTNNLKPVIGVKDFLNMRDEAEKIFIHNSVYKYIVNLVRATRENPYLAFGASPRATIALTRMSRAAALLNGVDYVSPADVAEQFLPVTRHRVLLNSKARADGQTADSILENILNSVQKPLPGGNYKP